MSLSPQTISVVKQTAPAVAENAVKITTTFYKTMFANNPEVLAFFNKANQERGQQQQALADAVVAYASNIDNLGALGDLVNRMAHRHVALSVTPAMYPTVHANMMKAVAEVLGSAVTPEIANAWSEAVLALAGICIAAEEALYKELEARAGGWRGEKEFRLVKRETVAQDTVAFSFARDDYTGGYEFTPGQYLTVRIPGLEAAPRHYTLTSKPGAPVLQCTTRRVSGGRVSSHMHDELREGATVLLGPPCGVGTLKSTSGPKVLVSAGIGITTSWAFLQQVGSQHVRAVLHVDKREARHAFRREFEQSGAKCTWIYTGEDGRPKLMDELRTLVGLPGVGTEAEFYLCGPTQFMADAGHALAALGAKRIYTEIFGTGVVRAPGVGGCPMAAKASGANGCCCLIC